MTDISLVIELTILVLAIFLGFEVISKVPTMLHTPLMSGTNFIHGIVIVGAIIVLGFADDGFTKTIGFVAMVLASANVVGGWFVTDRMLEMFKRRPETDRRRVISDPDVVGLLYLVAIVCFILALRFLSSPKHARQGNWVGGVGMLVAIATTLALDGICELGPDRRRRRDRRGRRGRRRAHREDDRDAADGGPVQRGRRRRGGARRARGVPRRRSGDLAGERVVSIVLSALIGSISFAGSLVAFAKLQELLSGRPIVFAGPERRQRGRPARRRRARHRARRRRRRRSGCSSR